MNTDKLREAYDQFLETVADRGRFGPPPPGEWTPELVLAHVAVGDRVIAQAAAQVMAGRQPELDNFASQSRPYLEAVAQAAGSWDGLVRLVRQAGDELIALAERMTDEQAGTLVHSRILDGTRMVVDAPFPIGQAVMVPAVVHLAGHAQQLLALQPQSAPA
jgi:hypothetical protein